MSQAQTPFNYITGTEADNYENENFYSGYQGSPDVAPETVSPADGQSIPSAVDAAGNVIAGAEGNAITAAAQTASNTLTAIAGSGLSLASSWFVRGAFFLLGFALLLIGVYVLLDKGATATASQTAGSVAKGAAKAAAL